MYIKPINPFQSKPISKGVIQQAINETPSMKKASEYIGCSYNTFKKYAKMYEVFQPNQSGKGISKNINSVNHWDHYEPNKDKLQSAFDIRR